MKAGIKKWARECLPCQTSKIMRHTEMGIGEFQTTQWRLAHIHVDIMGSLPPSNGYRYLFKIIDRNTRWQMARSNISKAADSKSCAKALIDWVRRHGVLQYITSDRGANFTSTLRSSLTASLGTKLIHTTAYNPEATGMVERCSLKSALTARFQGGSWRKKLLWVLLGSRTALHAAFNTSPAEAIYHQALTIPADVFQETTEPMTLPDVRHANEGNI
ncbi:uncharacterized protein [Macrobrachium rosenbergii]|uniref:uncharacterized protein n=1 Tax=Macrobrachium rosenbergii TaxID=79674 RepID=UPI0034D67545